MLKTTRAAVYAVTAALATSVSFGLFLVSDKGNWPDSWPQELAPLRTQACTYGHDSCDIHHIPFANRDDFERAWPHILTLQSKGAPLELLGSPHEFSGNTIKAGVRIWCPHGGEALAIDDKNKKTVVYPSVAASGVPAEQLLTVGPPWPDYLRSASGALPEYVCAIDGKWQAYERGGPREKDAHSIRKTQTTIQLIVDGSIVDLNRIALPPDTPIIDKRFRDAHNE